MFLNPRFAPLVVARIDLDAFARVWLARHGVHKGQPNPLLDPHVCAGMVLDAHREMGVDLSYGGWMEDRSTLWRGSYLDEGEKHLHLGIDINIPQPGVLVAVDQPSTVLHVDCDVPEEHGWGTRVIVHPEGAPVVLIYAHLAEALVKPEERLGTGQAIGTVGTPEVNGGWFPHVHVQAIDLAYFTSLQGDLAEIDGYGPLQERELLARRFPDPMPWFSIPLPPARRCTQDHAQPEHGPGSRSLVGAGVGLPRGQQVRGRHGRDLRLPADAV